MASRRYPPVPKAARRIIWLGRAISAIGLVIGVYVGMQLASRGQTSRAFLILSLAAVYVLTTWVSALSPLLWVSVGGMVLIFVVLEPNVISVTLVVAVAVLFWMRGKGQTSPIDPAGLRPAASDAVMPGAERFVTQLTERGWRQAGAYAFDSKRASVTASVLVHPDLDRYADITDMVFGIESRFEGSRMLITLNTGHGSLPPNYLGNGLVGASPAELADAHQQALDIIATFDVAPLHINEKTVVSEALASEVETIQWSKQNPPGGLFNFGRGVGLLDESPEATERIQAWLAFESVDQ